MEDSQDEFDWFDVWPENWDAVDVFMQCDTQWTVLVGFGGVHHEGLDYRKVASVARDWCGLELSRDLLGQIRVMENEAKQILNH